MRTLHNPRPWCPPRPVPPPRGFIAVGGTFVVPGVAVVLAAPYRSRRHARQFAERIAREPAAYLNVLVGLNVSGVLDRRPASHARPAPDPAVVASRWERGPGVPRRPAIVHGRRWSLDYVYSNGGTSSGRFADTRALAPVDVAATADALAALSAGLPATAAADLAHAAAGGELPDDVAALVRGRFTRDQLAAVLGLIGGGHA